MTLKGIFKLPIKKFLFRLGYDLHHVDNYDILPRLIKKNLHPNFFFIQIGANNGRRFDPLFELVNAYNLSGLAVEPVAEYFAELKENYKKSRVIPVNNAIYFKKCDVTINRVVNDESLPEWAKGIASLDPNHHKKSGIEKKFITQEVVKAITFTDLLDEYKVANVDVLMIDTEGFDKEIVKMIPFERISPKIIQFEHNLSVEGMSVAEFIEIISSLINRKYKITMTDTDCIAYK
jgi:FkbM family methyltransferase